MAKTSFLPIYTRSRMLQRSDLSLSSAEVCQRLRNTLLQVRLNLHLHQFIFFILGKDSLGQISHSLTTSQWGDNQAIH